MAVGLALALALVAAAVFVGWRWGQDTESGAEYPRILSDFQLAELDGTEALGPPDLRGDVVVIDFWATWCAPCHIQSKIIAPLHEEYGPRGVSFLAVNVGEDLETVRAFVEDSPFPYPVLLDPEARVTAEAELYSLPTLLILDKQGEVAFLSAGITGRKALVAAIEGALDAS